ncbi:hypothetical protein PS3A_03380 [Pseudomonas sp. 3A(2025)]
MTSKYAASSFETIRAQFEKCTPKASYADVNVEIDVEINASDKSPPTVNTVPMTDITREELSKTLSAIEERMDKRVERMEKDADRRASDARREMEMRDAALRNEQALRERSLDDRLNGFLAAQAERDKAQLERDKRYEMLAERVTQAAEGAEDAAKQAATVKSNYWAAVIVQLLAVVAILVGAYFANQGNTLMVAQTTLAAFTSGQSSSGAAKEPPAIPPPLAAPAPAPAKPSQ